MMGKHLLLWMHEQERTPAYLCRISGLTLDELIALITGDAVPSDEAVAALTEATGVPREQLESNGADREVGERGTDPLRCFTVKEVAALLQVSEDTVRAEIESGALGSVTIGLRVKRVPRAALEKRLSTWRRIDDGGMGSS